MISRSPIIGAALGLLASAALTGCLVGPRYQRPSAPISPTFKEAAGWSPAAPSDAADRKAWWTVFHDPILDDLEARVNVSNQTLAAAEAAYRQARALVAQERAALFPSLSLGASATAARSGGGSFTANGGTSSAAGTVRSTYQPSIGATWAPDIWGAVRRAVEGARANAQASAATLANARLSAQTELAVDYVQLREYDEQSRLFGATAEAYGRTLKIAQNKYNAGVVAKSDVLTAQSQYDSARANVLAVARQRAVTEHAIAILAGQTPASLTLPPAPWTLALPEIPAALPSTVLQRRPDIANQERLMAAANAQIGVQTAAYYPNLSLTSQGGLSSSSLGNLFAASSSFWSVGASLAETVLDFGARRARVAQARAAYDQAVANYRQTVLTAFGQVEDNLSAQRILGAEETLTKASADSATQSETITRNQYAAGTVDFTAVVVAETTANNARNTQVSIQAQRLTAAIDLIEALGGGWSAADLPKS
jgi:NodT family efflux transporter outer membrane factor (OMF) lipoprotein